MTILSDYVAGTIGLTNGQTAFTGTGTAWLSAGLGEGDKIYVDGFFGGSKIAAISAEGAGELAFAWPGATGTYAYRMEFLASPSRAAAKAQTAIDLLTSGLFQEVDAVGTFAGRDTFDGQPEGFVYASETDEAGNAISGFWIVYQKKSNADADWSIGAKTGGADGGVTNYATFGVLSDAIGQDGESALNLVNGDTYLKTAGSWTLSGSIKGDKGDKGDQGDQGSQGEQGIQGLPGSSDVTGTSTTSLAIETGAKAFTVAETDRGWAEGARLRAASAPDPANFMEGVITSYAGTALTITVDHLGGAGTHADWNFNLAGSEGDDGWTTELAVVADGERRVLQIDDYIGGGGEKPAGIGQYIGPAGLTTVLAEAVDIRGATGLTGERGLNWQGAWSGATNYLANDVVTDDDAAAEPAAWIALVDNTNQRPRDNPASWAYFPASFPTDVDYGLIINSASEQRDYGSIA